jgi:GNAT superfamily N-acetyltransferase
MIEPTYRSLTMDDKEWVRRFTIENWGADMIVAHKARYWPAECRGFAAFDQNRVVGLLTYVMDALACEIITINSLEEGIGIGSELIDLVWNEALKAGCKRLYLVTTNNNMKALRFYQKRGFHLCALHVGSVDEARKIKPEIPLMDTTEGIEIHDELELEIILK